MIEGLLLSVLAPAVLDFIKGAGGAIARRFFGLSVDDQIKVDKQQIEKLTALAALDNPHGTPSQWVVDLRASFRYISAAAVIVVGGFLLYVGADVNDELTNLGSQLVAMPFGFIFGERLVLALKGNPK